MVKVPALFEDAVEPLPYEGLTLGRRVLCSGDLSSNCRLTSTSVIYARLSVLWRYRTRKLTESTKFEQTAPRCRALID